MGSDGVKKKTKPAPVTLRDLANLKEAICRELVAEFADLLSRRLTSATISFQQEQVEETRAYLAEVVPVERTQELARAVNQIAAYAGEIREHGDSIHRLAGKRLKKLEERMEKARGCDHMSAVVASLDAKILKLRHRIRRMEEKC